MSSLRSSKRTTPRKRYTVDAFDGIQDLIQRSSPSEDGDDREEEPTQEGEEDVEDEEEEEDDFRVDAVPSEPDDDSMSGLDELGPVEEVDEGASDAGEADLDDSMSIIEDVGPSSSAVRGTTKRKRNRQKPPPTAERTYIRGVPQDLIHNSNKHERYKWILGPTEEDHTRVLKARDRWTNQLGLPHRKLFNREDIGGCAYSEAYLAEIDNAEINWEWYSKNGGRELFKRRQVVRDLTLEETYSYLPAEFELRPFVMGPVERRQIYNMKVRQFLSISSTFAQEPQNNGAAADPSSSPHKGFVLNLGAKVQGLDWAPCQAGPEQYLAVTVLPRRSADYPAPEAPSFAPRPKHRSSIQIWKFSADANSRVDDTVPPGLKIVLCAAKGDIKTIKWCPVPHKHTESLGLLACIAGDGALRVFDVARSAHGVRTTNVLVERTAFECRPPNTVCTSLTWISSSRVAVACANGFVAVWDIDKAMQSGNENPRPAIYADISTTYIMSITSCYPSHPHMIATTSLNGYMMLTDLRELRPGSRTATTLSSRTRVGQPFFAWHEFARTGISVEDNQTVRCYPLRRFFNGLGTGKIKGHVTSLATSMCHPYVLIASAAGEVTGHNPIHRTVQGSKTPLYSQRWFTHEWRRPTDDEIVAADDAIEGDTSDEVHALIGREGLSRITDGFKPHTIILNNPRQISATHSTIYEEKSAVTALAWNPNVHVGGWAAAGMADGLLKVEDVAA